MSEVTVNIVNLKSVDVRKWQKVPGHIYIGRKTKRIQASIWCNHFKISDGCSRAEVIKLFEQYLTENVELLNLVGNLKDKILGCWCSPLPCHGEILHRFAGNRPVYGS